MPDSLFAIQHIDKRRLRAMALTSQIMHIVGKYIDERDERYLMREICEELQGQFEKVGAEVITDFDRQQYGMSPRGPDGWTMEEIIELEKRRIEMMFAPMPTLVMPRLTNS